MTIRKIAPLPASPPWDEHLEDDESTARIVFEMLFQTTAAEACIKNSQRLFKDLGCSPSPDECIHFLQQTVLSLDQIFLEVPPQSDDEVVQESWSTIEKVRETMNSTILKLKGIKNATPLVG